MKEKRRAKKEAGAQRKLDAKATVERETRERREAAHARGDVGKEAGTVLETAVKRMRHCLRENYDQDRRDDGHGGFWSDSQSHINQNELDGLEFEWFRDAMTDLRSRPQYGVGAPDRHERELIENYDEGKAGDVVYFLLLSVAS